MKKNKKTSVRCSILILISVNIGLLLSIVLLFETALRIFTPDWLEYRMKYLNVKNVEKEKYGSDKTWKTRKDNMDDSGRFISFEPNSNFTMYHLEYEKQINIDKYGCRKIQWNNVDSTEKIIFLGDSFTFGVGVEDDETYVNLLQKHFPHQFLNMGIPGATLPIYRYLIEKRIKELEFPKLFVISFFLGNDFEEIRKHYIKKENRNNKSVKNNSNIKDDKDIYAKTFPFLKRVNIIVFDNRFLKKIYTIQYFRQKLLSIVNRGQGKLSDPIFRVMNTEEKEYHHEIKIYLDKEIYLLKSFLEENNSNMLFILIPDRYQTNDNFRKIMCKYYNLDFSKLYELLPNKLIISILNKYNIPYIDSTDYLKRYESPHELYYTQDNHLTNVGHIQVSNSILNELKKYLE